MLVNEWALFVRMALDTGRVSTNGELRLLRFKPTMGIVTVAAGHSSLKHLVMERLAELRFCFAMAANTELRFALPEHNRFDLIRFLFRRGAYERHRLGFEVLGTGSVRRVAIDAADIVAPMHAASKIVVAFSTGMAAEARLRDSLRILADKCNYAALNGGIINVLFAWPMTRLATLYLVFPAF